MKTKTEKRTRIKIDKRTLGIMIDIVCALYPEDTLIYQQITRKVNEEFGTDFSDEEVIKEFQVQIDQEDAETQLRNLDLHNECIY
ncbi:hypothetical protein KKH23_07295 [Patescibacteria group bacterium]|nr:hypothetical protein [Patescibacteria group bacterium]